MNIEQIIGNEFHGCIQINQKGRLILQKAYGYRDLPNQIPNRIDTSFATASAGKIFIAVAILQLIEKGFLDFEDTIGNLLDFDLHDIDPDITVEQLLTHTSGIPDYFDETVMDDYEELWIHYPNYKIRSSSDLIPLFIQKPMMYGKGEKFQYNNTGYVALGLIIETVTKAPFDQYLDENIFQVCKMLRTGYYELDMLPGNCANNYIYDEVRKNYRTNIYSVDVKGTGAGGAFTTAPDIQLFWEALLSHRLLSPEMTGKMLQKHSGNAQDGYYGYGIWLRQESDDTWIPYFQGCDPGVSFISAYLPTQQCIITLISNFGNDVWSAMNALQLQILED